MSGIEKINRALSSRATLQASYDIARLAIERNVPGDFVECGVFAGAQCAAMAQAIIDDWEIDHGRQPGELVQRGFSFPRPDRRVHLFDSFRGIPAGGPNDKDWLAGGHEPGTSAASVGQVKANMVEWGIPDELLVYHAGLFENTLPRFSGRSITCIPPPIAVLRLDGDLYESTRTALYYLLPLISPGGWIIVDDFNLDGCRKAVLDYCYPSAPAPIYWQKPRA